MAVVTLKHVREKLHPDVASVKNGVFTVKRGFFYTGGFTAEGWVKKIQAEFPDAIILGCGEVWKAFRGGASVSQQSHWWVKFEVREIPACPSCGAKLEAS